MASITWSATSDASTVPMGFIPVRIMPGMTTLTPIGAPTANRSARNTSDSPRTPCLATVYGPSDPMARTDAIDAVFTTWPSSPLSRMSGTKVCTPWITPHRFTSITRCHSSSVSSHARPPLTMPALFTATWSAP